MKIGEELHCKVCRSPRPPRLTLVPNSQHDQKDVPITDWRKSDDRENEVNKQRVTCSSSRVDFRIPGIPHSTVEKVETNRKKSDEINHVSRESKDLISEIGNTETFEFYETPSKRQCPYCASYLEFGIVFCTSGKCMQPTAMNRQYNKDRFDIFCHTLPHCMYRRRHFVGTTH